MKVRSLLLGSVAAAGLSTGAFAADLGVLTSLDVCDALGLSGLTISSDTTCLQVSGGVAFEFNFGDYRGKTGVVGADVPGNSGLQYGINGTANPGPNNNGVATPFATTNFGIDENDTNGPDLQNDWETKLETFLKFVATSNSTFGPAKAVIKLREIKQTRTRNVNNLAGNQVANGAVGIPTFPFGAIAPGTITGFAYRVADGVTPGSFFYTSATGAVTGPFVDDDYSITGLGGDDTGGLQFQEAYVAIGDSTMIMVGRKPSLFDGAANEDADAPFNILGLFNSERVDLGVGFNWNSAPQGVTTATLNGNIAIGGTVIQVVSDLGNGFSIGGGLEDLQSNGAGAGTAVGVINYAGDNIIASVAGFAGGILDGVVSDYAVHAAVTAAFDNIRVRLTGAAEDDGYWNVLGSAEATFDIFTLAISGEATSGNPLDAVNDTEVGAGASIAAKVTDGVSIHLAGRWFDGDSTVANTEGYQVEAGVTAALTETLTLAATAGYFGTTTLNPPNGLFSDVGYGAVEAKWNPGGNFTASVKGQAQSNGAYKATMKSAVTF